jgi:hypothetical protein
VSATINRLGYTEIVYTKKDSISGGFKLSISEPSYKIVGFRVYFYGKYMDLYWKDISGDVANQINLPVLKNLHGDEWMEIDCITIEKSKNRFRVQPFKVWITP